MPYVDRSAVVSGEFFQRHPGQLPVQRLAALATVMTRPDDDERAEIAVNADNTAAVQLFRRCGFHPDSRTASFTAQQ